MAVLASNAELRTGSAAAVHAEVSGGRVRTLAVLCQVVPAQEFVATSTTVRRT